MVAHVQQQCVAAAREQAQERRLHRVGLEVEGRDVAVQVVDRDERQPPRPRDRLGGGEPDEQRADQARARGDADRADVPEVGAGLPERLAHDRRDELEVAPRSDLRHHASVARVQVGLRRDDVGEDAAVLGDERGSRLVTGGLDA